MHNLASKLRSSRAAAGLSQDDLAARLHVTRQAISHWETGRSEPDLDTLAQLARELGTDAASLIGENSSRAALPRLLSHPWFEPLALGLPCLVMILNDLVTRPLANPIFSWARLYLYGYLPLMYGLLGAAFVCALDRATRGRIAITKREWRVALLCATLLGYGAFFCSVYLGSILNLSNPVALFIDHIRAVYLVHDWARFVFPTLAGGMLWLSFHKPTSTEVNP